MKGISLRAIYRYGLCRRQGFPLTAKSGSKEKRKKLFRGFFNYDNGVWRTIGRVGDLIVLNLLFLLCSIPVVTMGASLTALYYSCFKILRDEDSGIFKTFFRSFRQNLKQGSLSTVLSLLLYALLLFDLRFFSLAISGMPSQIFRIVTLFLLLLLTMVEIYLYPLLARFESSTAQLWKNALWMSVCHLPMTLFLVLLDVLIGLLFCGTIYVMPPAFPFVLMTGVSLPVLFRSFLLQKLFQRYMPKERETSEEKDKTAE